ncbi:MAG: hypothetical protein WB987_05030 [Candidatus Acidiferrales bacterium]
MRKAALCLVALVFAAAVHAQQKEAAQDAGDKHCEMMKRGEHEMGFSQEKTTHHFLLYKDGGAIDVAANGSGDAQSREQVRAHLAHIAEMFAAGNFEAPMFIHDTIPPGVATMTKLHDQISYRYEETAMGARVRITTKSEPALDAVHAFLLFQMADHRTGDSPAIAEPAAVR